MQLIATFAATPYLKTTFDADADGTSQIQCLFAVNDHTGANTWVAKARQLGNLTDAQFLRTA